MIRTRSLTAFPSLITFHLLALALTAFHLYVWTLPRTPTPIPEPNMPEAHWWGLWPVTYLPGWAMGLGVGLIGLTVVISVWQSEWVAWLWKSGRGWRHNGLWGVVIGLLVIGFYAFPTAHTRWGDAYILTKALALADPALRLTHSWQAPLDVRLHSQLWLTLHERFGWEDAMPVYHLLSPLAGLLYLLAAVGISRQLTPLPRWVTFALLTSIGVMQLFFGYIENYSFAAAGILLYLWLALAVLAGRRPLWQATLALALTNAFHPSTIVYGPSLLYCGWCCWRGELGGGRRKLEVHAQPRSSQYPIIQSPNHQSCNKSWGTTVFQLALPMLLVGGGTILMMELGGHGIGALLTTDRPGGGDGRWLVPLWETTTRWEQYTLFSWPHLRDLLNQQLLVAPVVLPGVLGFVISGQWTVVRGQSQSTVHRSQFAFLTLAAAAHLLLTWVWNPDYGGQRDWDLFSLAAIPLTVLFAFLLAQRFIPTAAPSAQSAEKTSTQRMVLAGIIPLLVLQYLHTAAWIYQNTLPWEWP